MPSIHDAAKSGDIQTITTYVANHGDVNSKDWNGWGPAHHAASAGQHEALQLLMDAEGAVVDLADNYGDTALHHASEWGKVECIKVLLEHNAGFGVKNQKGKTPVDVAGTGSFGLGFYRVDSDVKTTLLELFEAEPEKRRLSAITRLSAENFLALSEIKQLEHEVEALKLEIDTHNATVAQAKQQQDVLRRSDDQLMETMANDYTSYIDSQMAEVRADFEREKKEFEELERQHQQDMEQTRLTIIKEKKLIDNNLTTIRDESDTLEKKLREETKVIKARAREQRRDMERSQMIWNLNQSLSKSDFGSAKRILRDLHDANAPKETIRLAQEQLFEALEESAQKVGTGKVA
ncbi:hypothetical protein SARC_08448 [Sphaeroforma arctica JP610]|uniref:Uncharacterized protein n=1 Tax=Sphaeroforma arctica JP610 TaxID=667725 RepID=A0A0L0FR38_9EUKA|nr:hypothetical protein SARC_08448 [Sphaeroforma arctica JP610]KNC79149.1 hypothetical protein SARC_08448 [Sphaeroforma arctica JP610]|eukprot:XP_014153051.1 hypothetical protein SARC_08448 [Sphaeroforma arctica JP610]